MSNSSKLWIKNKSENPLPDERFCLGRGYTEAILRDPMSFAWSFARYKFVARVSTGYDPVCEIGCGEGLGAPMFNSRPGGYLGIEIDPAQTADTKKRLNEFKNVKFVTHDLCSEPLVGYQGQFRLVFLLDVLEHIYPAEESVFMENALRLLSPDGMMIIGVPSLEGSAYASHRSKLGHVNLKSQLDGKSELKRYFRHVISFSMNDEVVHTGFAHMSHYNLFTCFR
jgi:SAM-dependent methyltransferase